jgi:hypothetical protein
MVITLKSGNKVTIAGTLTMREFRQWLEAEKSGDLTVSYKLLAKLISSWDYPFDPKNPDSFDNLTITEYQEIVQAVAKYLVSPTNPN